MKFEWLEKMAEDGLIRDEVKTKIYEDIVKVADIATNKEKSEAALKLFDMLAAGLASGLAGALTSTAKEKYEEFKGRRVILANRELLGKQFANDAAKAKARFDELASFAPHVAANQALATRLIADRLHDGFTDSDVQNLALLQSKYLPDAFRSQKFSPKLAEVRPEKLGEITADVYMLSKTATDGNTLSRLGRFAKHVGMYASIPLLIGAGAGAVNKILSSVDKKNLERKLDESFRRAVAISDPEKEALHANRDQARQAFNALAHFAPHVALEPQAARAFMSKIVSYDQGMNISDIKDLSEIQRNLTDKKPSNFISGFQGTGNQIGEAARDAMDTLTGTPN